jgi:hypothetical protein
MRIFPIPSTCRNFAMISSCLCQLFASSDVRFINLTVELIIGVGPLLDEPNASAVRKAFEGFALGRFASQMGVKCFSKYF